MRNATHSVTTITTLAGLEGLEADYRRLESLLPMALPFQLHEWHVAWWRHFPVAGLGRRDELHTYVVRRRDGTCVGIAPFFRTLRPGIGPLQTRTMQLVGADPYITEIRVPLIDPSEEPVVARMLLERLASDPLWDSVQWSGLERESAFSEVLDREGRVEFWGGDLDYVLDLAPDWDTFRKNLKRNIRESLRHCYNSLKRDGHAFTFNVAETPAEVLAGVEVFFDLHSRRASLEDTITHPNRFELPVAQAFLRDVMERLAKRGIAKVFTLEIGGTVVGVRMGFQIGTQLYLYYSGYDPEWRKYSVMTTTVSEAIRWAIEQKLVTVNLSAGTDVSKTRWGARGIPNVDATQIRGTLRSRLASEAMRLAWEARRNPEVVKFARKLVPSLRWT